MNGDEQSSTRPGWLIDEIKVAGAENLDPDHVALYDDKEDARPEEEAALLQSLGMGDTSIVVDLGAGTGQFTIAAARRAGKVIAVDVSPLMLDQLRAKIARERLDNVTAINAGFLTYEHVGPLADFVYCRWALHHLPDLWKALALHRIRRVLPAGGVLRLSDLVFAFPPQDIERQLDAWSRSLPVTAATPGAWVRADIDDHIRDEHSTFTWLLEPMIEAAGFTIESAAYSDDGFSADYVARAT